MHNVRLSVGRKIFSFKCDERDLDKIKQLSVELNTMVNKNSVKYKGLSDENVFLLTAFELLDSAMSGNETDERTTNTIEDKGQNAESSAVKYERKASAPELHHPYPTHSHSTEGKWIDDLFGYEHNNEENAVDSLLLSQEYIHKELNEITEYLNAIIISMSNAQ